MGPQLKKASTRQQRLIRNCFKIEPPGTEVECRNLINYVLCRDAFSNERVVDRIRRIRKLLNRWNGAIVQFAYKSNVHRGHLARVIRLKIRSLQQIAMIRSATEFTPIPVVAVIQLDSGKKLEVPLNQIKIVIKPGQPLLFSLVDP